MLLLEFLCWLVLRLYFVISPVKALLLSKSGGCQAVEGNIVSFSPPQIGSVKYSWSSIVRRDFVA